MVENCGQLDKIELKRYYTRSEYILKIFIMEKLIPLLITKYKSSRLYKHYKSLYQLTLFQTHEGEFHLINTGGFGVHCNTNRRYSSIANKQLKLSYSIPDNKWKISDYHSCKHGSFSSLESSDLSEGWIENLIVKKPSYPHLLRPV